MFLLIFRYVFGGAIGTGGVAYADFLIPGMAAAGGCSRQGGAVGVADDIESGLFDRLRSLPVPRSAVLLGRSLADTALVALGHCRSPSRSGSPPASASTAASAAALAAFGLCVLFGAAFTWPFIYMGLVSGSAQAAQGMSFLAFPFVFVSSAYVPVDSMPGWLQPVAEHQPVTAMVGAVRALVLGDDAEAVLGHSAGWFMVRAVLWSVAIVAVFVPLATRRFARR